MFENRYKSAMDKVSPSEDALNKALNAPVKKRNVRNILRTAAVACVLVALTCTTVFTAFKLSNINLFNDNSQGNNGNSNRPNSQITLSLSEQGFKYAENYNEIYEYLKESSDDLLWEDNDAGFNDFEAEETPDTNAPVAGIPNETPEHSDTNNQVSGVQEGDVIKNDGRYIYHLSKDRHRVYIISATDGKTDIVSEILIPNGTKNKFYPDTLLLVGNTLVIIGTDNYYNGDTICMYYDISDKSKPVKTDETKQSGHYRNCRVVDGTVYIISQQYSYIYDRVYYSDDNDLESENDLSKFIPEIDGELIGCEDILISDDSSSQFTIITAYDAVNKERKSSLALLGSCQSIYCSKENIYIASSIYLDDEDMVAGECASFYNTKILRVALNNGDLSASGATTVCGQINNQFSMDEKDGIFRIATTITPLTFFERGKYMESLFGDTYNKVYCLDSELKVIGESEKLGVTERIKSVRYLGDIAYVVTFRQTDPLYAIDLTDPTNPKTLSALKIDGFSTYMQPYGKDYMLGIGYAADSDGRTNGIKLTMFDITNPADVFDISSTSFLWNDTEYMNVMSDALSNHKAVLIDYKKGIIGLPFIIERYEENKNWEYEYKLSLEYKLFSFDGKELAVDQSISITLDEKTNFWSGMRGLYIGDYLYIALESGLVSVSLNDYSVVDTIKY